MAFGYFLNILLGKPWLEGENDETSKCFVCNMLECRLVGSGPSLELS
jgi:hypothetical protein